MNKLIYVIDDEKDLCNLICSELELYGFKATSIYSGAEAMSAIQKQKPSLCIIDLGLPDMDGLNIIKSLSNSSNIGVLILSGRDSLPDKVLGLELGADDYISKPFEIRELIARVNSLLRRIEHNQTQVINTGKRCAKFSDWVFDVNSLTLSSSKGDSHMLSSAEANLLNTLLKRPKQIVSRDQLLGDQITPYDRSIDSRMSRLRRKIENNPKQPEIIKTVYGAGYMLSVTVEWADEIPSSFHE